MPRPTPNRFIAEFDTDDEECCEGRREVLRPFRAWQYHTDAQTSFTRSTLDPYEEYVRWREWYESILLEQQNELRLARTRAIAEFIEETRKLDLNALSSPMRRPKVDLVMRRFLYCVMTFE